MAAYALFRPKVIKDASIERLRIFPSVGESTVSPGSKVEAGSILGKYASRQRLRYVKMETSGDRITATVLVAEGQKVKRGEVLGYYSYMFGLGYTEYISPCDGEIVGISHATGRVSIKEEPSDWLATFRESSIMLMKPWAFWCVPGATWLWVPPGQVLPGRGLS